MGRMADAEKLSIPQLQQAIKNGTIPAYVGVPLLQDKVKQHQKAMAMQQAQQAQGQNQVPIAAQVMQDADQYRGIDELPTNLPTEEEDQFAGGEYASGGIIAFAEPTAENNNSLVTSKEQPSAFSSLMGNIKGAYKYATDPAFRAFVEDGGDKGDISVDAFRALGNDAPPDPKQTQAIKDQMARDYTDNVNEMTPFQRVENRPMLTPMSEGVSNLYNKILRPKGIDRTLKEGETQKDVPEGLYPYIDTGMFSQMPGGTAGITSAPPTAVPQERLPVAGSDTGAFQATDRGITTLPAGQNVRTSPNQPATGQRSAAPTSGAGTTTSTDSSRGNGAGGNVPSTLREAEAIAGKSPAAAQAVSAVDRYMAMLEKSGESVGREKKEALYMALITGGLTAAGGTSPNALANIAAGMVPATQQYQKAISDIRKDDRARVEKLLSAGMGKEKLALELKKLGIEEKKVDALVNYYNARAGAAGSGGDAAGDRQLRLLAFNSGKELTRVEADVARVRNSEEYREAARVLKMPFDPKSASPTIRAMRKNAEDTIGRIDTDLNRRLGDARDTVNFYRKEAGFESSDRTGSAGLPNGIPTGSRLAGKSGGKDVYEAPDGKRYIVD
jgi:hypothetical protein